MSHLFPEFVLYSGEKKTRNAVLSSLPDVNVKKKAKKLHIDVRREKKMRNTSQSGDKKVKELDNMGIGAFFEDMQLIY